MNAETGTITLYVGSVVATGSGIVQDNQREVTFEGEELASHTEYGYSDRTGSITDTRGVTETLFRTADGRLIVHVKDWSRWQGEPTVCSLHEVAEDDLQVEGRFEALGREAGFGRPLTLGEALTPIESEI
jgi:hypothetical protein